jgi:hypothetical protein
MKLNDKDNKFYIGNSEIRPYVTIEEIAKRYKFSLSDLGVLTDPSNYTVEEVDVSGIKGNATLFKKGQAGYIGVTDPNISPPDSPLDYINDYFYDVSQGNDHTNLNVAPYRINIIKNPLPPGINIKVTGIDKTRTEPYLGVGGSGIFQNYSATSFNINSSTTSMTPWKAGFNPAESNVADTLALWVWDSFEIGEFIEEGTGFSFTNVALKTTVTLPQEYSSIILIDHARS